MSSQPLDETPMIAGDRYLHFKGGTYVVLGVATRSETKERCVVYRSEASAELWIRSLENFNELVRGMDGDVPRFKLLSRQDKPAS